MPQITHILNAFGNAEGQRSEELIPFIYRELRTLAAQKMAGEAPGHTLQATALVHEAWLRLAHTGPGQWENRGHFFAAAAEAMRRILVEHARKRLSHKRGGGTPHEELDHDVPFTAANPDEILAVHESLNRLGQEDPVAAELVKLRYFAGMTMEEVAAALGLKKRAAESIWTFARVWLHREIRRG